MAATAHCFLVKFKVEIQKDEDGWYVVTVPALPGSITQGKTLEEARRNPREAIELHLESLGEDGIPIRRWRDVIETTVTVRV